MTMAILTGILLTIGFVLILVEVLVPGFGVFGVFGSISTVISVVLGVAYVENFWIVSIISLIIALSLSKFIRVPENMVLNNKSGVVEKEDKSYLLEKEGKVLTVLKPVGKCLIDDKPFECYALNGFIEKDKKIVVKEIREEKIFVEAI